MAVAAVCAAVGYIFMPFEGKTLPDTSCPAVVDAWARIATLFSYHNLKNLMTELFRCDAQWFAKFTMFVALVLLIWAVVATVKAIKKGGK